MHLDKQIESLKEIQKRVNQFKEKNLPIIFAFYTIESQTRKGVLGIQKTTNTISLGRKLTKAWAIRQFIYAFLTLTMIIMIIMIGLANRATSSTMLDNSLDQSLEFLRDGIRYYQFNGFQSHMKYFISVLLGQDEKYMHYYQYEDIDKVVIYINKKYMNLGSPLAYEVYVPDFEFHFQDGEKFYFFWPMILDDDARYIAYILGDKVKNIIDKDNILYAMKNGINITDYMQTK